LIFDIKRENIKSTIFIKNPIHPPFGFHPHAQTFRCAIPTVTCALFLLGDGILVLGASYMLLIWFFFKAKGLGNEKEIPHQKN